MRSPRRHISRTAVLLFFCLFVPACELIVNPDPTLVPGYGDTDGGDGEANADAASEASDAPASIDAGDAPRDAPGDEVDGQALGDGSGKGDAPSGDAPAG